MSRHFYVYSDGSFNKTKGIGVGGYLIFDNEADHTTQNRDVAVFTIEPIQETNNIRVELAAAIRALIATHRLIRAQSPESTDDVVVDLFTDSTAVASLPGRRAGLEATGYLGKRKGIVLACADLYADFYEMQDKLNLSVHQVRGHVPNAQRSSIERHFSVVDKAVRKALRDSVRDLRRRRGAMG